VLQAFRWGYSGDAVLDDVLRASVDVREDFFRLA
jgi:hypothetical protein